MDSWTPSLDLGLLDSKPRDWTLGLQASSLDSWTPHGGGAAGEAGRHVLGGGLPRPAPQGAARVREGVVPCPPEGAGELVVDRGDGGVAVGGEGGGGALQRHREMKSEKYEREGGYIVG